MPGDRKMLNKCIINSLFGKLHCPVNMRLINICEIFSVGTSCSVQGSHFNFIIRYTMYNMSDFTCICWLITWKKYRKRICLNKDDLETENNVSLRLKDILFFTHSFMLFSSVEHNCSGHRTKYQSATLPLVSQRNRWHLWIWLSRQTQNYKWWMKAGYQIPGRRPYTKLNSGFQLREHVPCASSLLRQRTRFGFLQG